MFSQASLLTTNGKKKRKRERKQKKNEIAKKRTLGIVVPFYRDYVRSRHWCPYGTGDASNVKKQNKTRVFCQPLRYIKWSRRGVSPRLFLTRSRLVLSSLCSVYLEARNNFNCNCIICEGLGYKEYEYRTESYAGMITWLTTTTTTSKKQ